MTALPMRNVAFQSMLPHRVAVAIFRELLEVRAFTALLIRLDPDLLQPVIPGEPRIACNLLEVRKDAALFALTESLHQLAETEPRAHVDGPQARRRLRHAASV